MPTGPGAKRAFKIATAVCKHRGYTAFKAGSPGATCRGQMAEKMAAKPRRRGR